VVLEDMAAAAVTARRHARMRKQTFTLFGMYLALLLVVGLLVSGCEPGGFPIIENNLNQDLRIYTTLVRRDGTLGEEIDYGVVPAQTTKELASITFVYRDWVY